jgi:homoserine dehydrogenase
MLQSFTQALQAFNDEVETHLIVTGIRPTTFGKKVLGDPQFVFDLRKGRQPRAEIIDKVRQFMRERAEAA